LISGATSSQSSQFGRFLLDLLYRKWDSSVSQENRTNEQWNGKMNVDEILRLTGASRSVFYRWRADHNFPKPVLIGRYDEAQVRGWWDTNKENVQRWPRGRESAD